MPCGISLTEGGAAIDWFEAASSLTAWVGDGSAEKPGGGAIFVLGARAT